MWSVQFQKIEEKTGLQRLRSIESQDGLQVKSTEKYTEKSISELPQKEEKDQYLDSNKGSSANLSGSYVFVDHNDANEVNHYSNGSFIKYFI